MDNITIESNEWPLYLFHEYHHPDESHFIILPNTVSYEDIYRTIAYIQSHHSDFSYDTEDLSGAQVAYALHLIYGYKHAPYGDEQITPIYLNEDNLKHNEEKIEIPSLNLFWNWEQGVVKFFCDKNLREEGKEAYFYPEININDYAIDNLHEILQKMDEHFRK